MATTSNMGLTLPDVSVTLGPTWASQINSDLTLLDQHNHTSGFGVQIPTAGLNIDGDLGFNNHAISGLSYLKLNPQAATLETSSLYVDSAGDFFYRNSAGAPVQITSAGGLAATPGSITNLPSGTAAVTFLSGPGRYVFTKSTNAGAVLDSGPLILRTGSVGSNGVVLTPHPSTTNYGLQLPQSFPAAQAVLSCSTVGVTSFTVTDSTLTLTSSLLQVASGGITATQLATDAVETAKIKDGAVTYAKLQASNCVVPSSGGNGSTTSTSYVGLTVPAALITVVAGRPLFISCVSEGVGLGGDEGFFGVSGLGNGYLRFFASGYSANGLGASVLSVDTSYPPACMTFVIQNPTAGTYTFYLEGKVDAGTTLSYSNIKVIAYQI